MDAVGLSLTAVVHDAVCAGMACTADAIRKHTVRPNNGRENSIVIVDVLASFGGNLRPAVCGYSIRRSIREALLRHRTVSSDCLRFRG